MVSKSSAVLLINRCNCKYSTTLRYIIIPYMTRSSSMEKDASSRTLGSSIFDWGDNKSVSSAGEWSVSCCCCSRVDSIVVICPYSIYFCSSFMYGSLDWIAKFCNRRMIALQSEEDNARYMRMNETLFECMRMNETLLAIRHNVMMEMLAILLWVMSHRRWIEV